MHRGGANNGIITRVPEQLGIVPLYSGLFRRSDTHGPRKTGECNNGRQCRNNAVGLDRGSDSGIVLVFLAFISLSLAIKCVLNIFHLDSECLGQIGMGGMFFGCPSISDALIAILVYETPSRRLTAGFHQRCRGRCFHRRGRRFQHRDRRGRLHRVWRWWSRSTV